MRSKLFGSLILILFALRIVDIFYELIRYHRVDYISIVVVLLFAVVLFMVGKKSL
ncbi:hypothetical protein [Paenibacillus tepidiphilus]|uniref:hypothetical protein n=1 Tax=Paenibacillus tepidiphilus TaxID=2608683 RepID=UPI0013A53F97|nr:hypothetical protein [Paenibacillus tepidiphilus]